jgi:hypothetical protein
MLTFPIWGIGLLGSLAKLADFPGFIPLGMFIALFSPLPIVLNERFGVLATLALAIGYCSLAVPVAILVLLLVGGQA